MSTIQQLPDDVIWKLAASLKDDRDRAALALAFPPIGQSLIHGDPLGWRSSSSFNVAMWLMTLPEPQWHIDEAVLAFGQNRSEQDRQRGVLGPGGPNRAAKRKSAFDNELFHAELQLAERGLIARERQ